MEADDSLVFEITVFTVSYFLKEFQSKTEPFLLEVLTGSNWKTEKSRLIAVCENNRSGIKPWCSNSKLL